ncbi:MAG: DUF2281 domain-containing protein [Flavobacteriales bacterium]|nr:DUF2281 domain-containing protein [Flavobacteriales bacterium]
MENFIEFLRFKNQNKEAHTEKRLAGKAKGFIKMKANFDDPIEGFNLNFK